MKILHLTDTHLTAKNPASRLDVFYESLLNKLSDVTEIIKQEQVDLVIHTGDLFHTSRIAFQVTGDLAQILRAWNVPILVVPGNHDLDGYNLSTINQTSLGLLARTGVVQLLTRQAPYEVMIDGLCLRIEGQEFDMNLDKGNPDDYRMRETKDLNILAAHGMLMEKPYFEEVPHTLIKDVDSNADIVLCGHYHPGFGCIQQGKTFFYNPGSMSRVEISKREPNLSLFSIIKEEGVLKSEWVKSLTFPSAKANEAIFDFSKHEEKKEQKQQLLSLKETIHQAISMTQGHPIDQLLDEMAKTEALDEDVVNKAKGYMDKAKQDDPSLMQEVKGYVTSLDRLSLVSVEIEDFLSHEKSVIELDPGFNAVIGKTNSGKSSIIRAILWCLYNEPKGTEFIRTGKKGCRVKCNFSNGSSIERARTLTSSGYYEVTDEEGTVQRYQGFGNDIPIQVLQTHQMPSAFLAKDRSVKLTVNEQLDGPFLLAESPQMKAIIVGRLVGTQYMDAAIKLLNKETTAAQRNIKTYQTQLEKWQGELTQFDDLPQLAEQIRLIEEQMLVKRQLEQWLEGATTLVQRRNGLANQKARCEEVLTQCPNLDELSFYEDGAKALMDFLAMSQQLLQKKTKLESQRDTTEIILSNVPDLSSLPVFEGVVNDLTRFLEAGNRLLNTQSQLQSQRQVLESKMVTFDSEALKRYVERANEAIFALARGTGLSSQLQQISHQIRSMEQQLETLNADPSEQRVAHYQRQLTALFEEQGTCPTCGTVYGDDQLQFLLEHKH